MAARLLRNVSVTGWDDSNLGQSEWQKLPLKPRQLKRRSSLSGSTASSIAARQDGAAPRYGAIRSGFSSRSRIFGLKLRAVPRRCATCGMTLSVWPA